MSVTVARSFRIPKQIDDQITGLMIEESRSRNNLVDILLGEALLARQLKGKSNVGSKSRKPTDQGRRNITPDVQQPQH